MAFVLELETASSQEYIKNYMITIIRSQGVHATVHQKEDRIIAALEAKNENLQACIEAISTTLPASCFLRNSTHYEIEGEPSELPDFEYESPLGLGLCPACQKELFDPSSSRYYYPFTSCTHCGGQYAFFEHYPFSRENSLLSHFQPCLTCKDETGSVSHKEKHHLNSCHSCGIPVKMIHKGKERYANDAGSFRTLFEVAAKALRDGKSVIMKTTLGYRKFYLTSQMHRDSILMLINAAKITQLISITDAEFNALLSIERPILHVALKDTELKAQFGFSSDVKYPDDGFTLLLAKELLQLGIDTIAYESVDAEHQADYLIDYDLDINTQEDLRLYVTQESRFIISGERVAFPARLPFATETLSVAHNLVSINDEKGMLFDQLERFESVTARKVMVFEDESIPFEHTNVVKMAEDEAAFMSVIAEHHKFGVKTVGAYFRGEPSLLYYDGKKVIRVVPPINFNASQILQKISELREGSDRLVEKITQDHPKLHEDLLALNDHKADLFEAVAIILELDERNYRGVMKEALKFVGKGGLQVDTKVNDNRFDHSAFIASIISYKLADVDVTLLCYSIFESFGDYFSELLQEIQGKTKASEVVLCGEYFGNPSLFSRMQRNFKLKPPLLNKRFPIGKESSVVGGAYL
ncbi:MAG: hypothetical protein U9N52_13550 [Campylobacterota bacterium]|nr:hypothetical protein [Campylobacterota bacterium]